MKRKILKKLLLIGLIMSIIWTYVCFASSPTNKSMYGDKTLNDFKNAKIATLIGTINDEVTKMKLPDSGIVLFNNWSDVYANIKMKKIEAASVEYTSYCEICRIDNNYKIVQEPLGNIPQAYMLSKKICNANEGKILNELNAFIEERKNSGWLKAVENKWLLNESAKVEYKNKIIANPKMILSVAFSPYMPYAFLKGNDIVGMDVEIIEAFAEKYNYGIKYENVDFTSSLAGVGTGKYDIAISGITVTDERKKNAIFSDVYFNDKIVLVYYEKDNNNVSFIENLKNSFAKSFIIEERYKMVIYGIINTILITILSMFGGIAVGFLLYVLYRKKLVVANRIIDLYAYIINGLPFLVLLLVLYYVVFAKVNISGIIVSILAFIMTFGLYIFSEISTNISLIDKGQMEAAYALGYTDNETFIKVLLPQAILQIYPGFREQVVTLLKETSIVGYIAVADLTRAGDLIRSRTYEAFFPIISIAIIYFVIGIIFKTILGFVGKKINPKNRSKENILKGVVYDKN